MGFQKGSITLSPAKDIPILLQVLHSRFITHDQLFEFMLLDCYELKRASFNWRVRRLVQSGLLIRHCARPVTPSPVYSLTHVGALMLADHCPVLDRPKRKGCRVSRPSDALHRAERLASQSRAARRAGRLAIRSDDPREERIDEIRVREGLRRDRHGSNRRTAGRLRPGVRTNAKKIEGLFAHSPSARTGESTSPLPVHRSGTETGIFHPRLLHRNNGRTPCRLGAEFTRSFTEMSVVEATSGRTKPLAAFL